MRKLILAIAVGLGAAPPVWAEDVDVAALHDMSLDDLLKVDIGTGTSKFLHQTPAMAEVVTHEEIERMGAEDLFDVLRGVPGIYVYLSQNNMLTPEIDIRGIHSDGAVLFLRDGKPIRTVAGEVLPPQLRIPVHFIDRIEVIRGPGSALYGADAFAGVINIITKTEPDAGGIRYGSFNATEGWLGVHDAVKEAARGQDLKWAANATYSRSDGDSSRALRWDSDSQAQLPSHAPGPLVSQYEDGDADVRLKYGPLSAHFWLSVTSGAGGWRGQQPVLDPNATLTTHIEQEDITYAAPLTGHTDVNLSVTRMDSYSTNQTVLANQGDLFAHAHVLSDLNSRVASTESRSMVDASATETGLGDHRIRVATGGVEESFVDGPDAQIGLTRPLVPLPKTIPTKVRDTGYGAIQDEWTFAPNWELTGGVRYDHYSDFGGTTNPRAGLVWNVDPQLTTKLLYGQAFLAPSFGQLYNPNIGNPSLQPERIQNGEFAVDYRLSEPWRTGLNFFLYRSSNLIANFGPNINPQHPQGGTFNQGAQMGKGIEAQLGWSPVKSIKLDGSGSVIDTVNSQTQTRAPMTPREIAKVTLTWLPTDQWSVNLRADSYFEIARNIGDPRPATPVSTQLNGSVRYAVSAATSIQLSGLNLLNQKLFSPSGASVTDDFRLPGIDIFAQLEHRF